MSKSAGLGVQKEVQLEQGVIRYRESGSGEPLLFVHGLLANGDLWRKVGPELARRYRCIVPDWPLGSHELPMNPQADLSPAGLARLIADFMVALELTGVTLVGNDTGGGICQVVVANHPERLKRLILTNCDAFENFLPPAFSPMQALGWIPGSLFVAAQLLKIGFLARLAYRPLTVKPMEREVIESFLEPGRKDGRVRRDTGKILRRISNRYTKQAAKHFSEFNRPVLIAWGAKDPFFRSKFAKRLAQAFPNARLEFIENGRTFVMQDQPERLVELIEAFLGSPVATVG